MHHVYVYRVAENVHLSEQIKLAKEMRESFVKKEIKAEILAEFEHML